MIPDDPIEYQIQPPQLVAKRALALSAHCCRGFIDNGRGNADAESLQQRMIDWIARFELRDQLGTYEWNAITSPLGSLEPSITNQMTWECEGLAVLAWALGRGELPKHDGQIDPYQVTDAQCFLGDDAGEIVTSAQLCWHEKLRAYRELMYAIHCRVRDFMRRGKVMDFSTWIESQWLLQLEVDSTRIIVDGDLGFEGVRIDAVEPEQLKRYEWAICEQHRASIWLMGEETNHWETPADT